MDPLAEEDATPEASSGGMDEWVIEEDEPASVSSQVEGNVCIANPENEEEEEEEEEGGFFEESAEGKEFEV
jgi:hypothetical protein